MNKVYFTIGFVIISLFCLSYSNFDGDCQVNFLDYVIFANKWAIEGVDFFDLAQFAMDWLTCNRDPDTECWQ